MLISPACGFEEVLFVNPIVQKIIVCPPKKFAHQKKYLPYPPFRDDLPASEEDIFPKEIETRDRKEKK